MTDSSGEDLLQRLDLLQQILKVLPVGVWIMDGGGRIVYGNAAAQRTWAGARYVGTGQLGEYKAWRVSDGARIAPESWAAARAVRTGEISVDEEIEIECFDGTRKFILNSAVPLSTADGRIAGAVQVQHDITERKRLEERLRAVAEHDELTGAYNRRFLFEFLKEEIERCRRYRAPLSVIMFDLDHFKKVNDTHGHQAGDRLLAGIVECVRGELRAVDVLARYGGEEFVVAAPGIGWRQAEALAERLRARIAAERFDALPQVTCSFGVCGFDGGDADSLIRRADELMYEAKRKGRNCVVASGEAAAS